MTEEAVTNTEDETEYPIPDEAPAFSARIVYQSGDYTVVGTFTDFTPDITRVDTLYSLDGVNWQASTGGDWNLGSLDLLGTADESKLYGLQNQECLLGHYEPLRSYRTGDIDRFYVKLQITKKNGLSYETQSAVFDREDVQPIPDGVTPNACFSRDIMIIEWNPLRLYANYQLTISADATAEDVAALLPDTLPVQIDLTHGSHNSNIYATGVVDCPVTWKPLSLPRLSAGESITISDAAEAIFVPAGTLLRTPLGIFQLNEPLSLDTPPSTDEIRLVLNVSAQDGKPTGVLREGTDGLELALVQKPTGATSIQAYVMTEGESTWTELSGLSLPEEFYQPSTENSGYALVLRNDQEPYRSYLEATAAGTAPAPFFVGLKIEGGIYDGRQLILAWPDIYEELPDLPEVGGSSGNEGNAGADNNDDGTEGGQRPDLPQIPDDDQEEQLPPQTPDDNTDRQPPSSDSSPDDVPDERLPDPDNDNNTDNDDNTDNGDNTDGSSESGTRPGLPQISDDTINDGSESGQRPNLPRISDDAADEPQTPPDTDNSGQTQPISPTYTPETAFAIPEIRLIPEQRKSLLRAAADTADTSDASQRDGLPSVPSVSQDAADRKDAGSVPPLSEAKTTAEYTHEKDSRIPLLSVTAVIAAGGCFGAVVCKTAGYGLLRRIAGIIRSILH